MMIESRRTRAHLDVTLLLLVFGLSIFGVLAIAVATYSTSSDSSASLLNHIVESSSAMRQCLFLLVSVFLISLVLNIPYDLLRRSAHLLYALATFLVLFTLVTNGAAGVKAWTDIIWGYTIQPSEFIKLALILMLARALARYERPMSNMKQFINLMVMVGAPCLIILASGEMGSLLVIVFIFAVMLYFSGTPKRVLISLAAIAIIGILLIYALVVASGSDNYRLQRILAFLNPAEYALDDAYQQTHSKICIGSGGTWGKGMFVDGSWSQLNFVPADWTDFIFATIGEAWGFIGCIAVLLTYLAIILRMIYLAYNTRDKFGMLVIVGVMAMMLFHVFENIGMTLGLMPITGIPLPFLSYGGSNMVTNMGGVALVLNVTKNRSLTTASAPQPQAMLKYYRGSL